MPILYYVPIIHSIEDYASLGPAIQKAYVRQRGEAAFAQHQQNIYQYWQLVEESIKREIPDVHGLIIYHDTFPVGSREKILAHFGHLLHDRPRSPDFQLIKKLLDRGAVLEGIENVDLIIEEFQLHQQAAEAASLEEKGEIVAANAIRLREILKLRDEFIAKRIHETLPEEGKGILFIGRAHDVVAELEKLPRKFTVIYL